MDNASIHRKAVLNNILMAINLLFGTNYQLLFLPAYSPELNPVRPRPQQQHTHTPGCVRSRTQRLPWRTGAPRHVCAPRVRRGHGLRAARRSQIELLFAYAKYMLRALGGATTPAHVDPMVHASASCLHPMVYATCLACTLTRPPQRLLPTAAKPKSASSFAAGWPASHSQSRPCVPEPRAVRRFVPPSHIAGWARHCGYR